MRYLLFIIILFTVSCAKQKSVLICGDHKCINKAEAKQYFEENLTIEVQIISKEKKTSYDLVDLNTGEENNDIKVYKNKDNKIVKKLSKEEIKEKKAELKKKEKSKLKGKSLKKDTFATKKRTNDEIISYSPSNNSIDICLKVKKCDIDSITDYLIKVSNDKDYPNISLRE